MSRYGSLVSHFEISVTPPISEQEFGDLPLPYQAGAYGREYIKPHLDTNIGNSILAYPEWVFPKDSKYQYLEVLRKHFGKGRIAQLTSYRRNLPELVILPGMAEVEEHIEPMLELLPSPQPEPVRPTVEPLPRFPLNTVRLVSYMEGFALAANPPSRQNVSTSWLWPDWHDGPAEICDGPEGSELYVYESNLDQDENPKLRQFLGFAELFVKTLNSGGGGYLLDKEIVYVETLANMTAVSASLDARAA